MADWNPWSKRTSSEALRKGQELAARTRRSVGTRIPSQDKNRNISLQKSAEEYEELWDEEQDVAMTLSCMIAGAKRGRQ